MKFAYGLPFLSTPHEPAFLTPGAVGELARAAEVAGFSAVYLTEHPMPTDAWRERGGHDALDPFVGLAFAAAATTSIRLLTNLTVLPYRNPFLLAKTVATLDVLSGGRVTLGAGTGYLDGEYRALGVEFADRNDLFDESLDAMRAAWTGDSVSFSGAHFAAEGNTAHPMPRQRPHPPIWIGGNSTLTRRRVAANAQGWMPFPNPGAIATTTRSPAIDGNADLARLLEDLWRRCRAAGRDDTIDVMYVSLVGGVPGGPDFDAEAYRADVVELSTLGVTWLGVNGSGRSRADALERIERFGRMVVAD